MTEFQDYVNRELPRRSAHLTQAITSYDGDPNDGGAPAIIQGAPLGTWFHEYTEDRWWRRALAAWVLSTSGVDFIVDRTEEEFTVSLDSGAGTDPTSPIRIRNQAQSDAWGAFATVPAAIDALPDEIYHNVTLEFPDGTWTTDAEGLGQVERFIFVGDPAIIYKSATGLVRESGTSTYAVSASSVKRQVVLQSDPGFSANDHQSKYLRIVSGTGAGQYKPIRSHSGVNWPVAGRFSPVPDATSVVEIVVPATTLQLQRYTDLETRVVEVFERNIIFSSLNLTSSESSPRLRIRGSFARFEDGTRLLRVGIQCYGGGINFETCIHDGLDAAIGVGGLNFYFRSSSSGEAWMIRNVKNVGVQLSVVGKGASSAFIWEGSIDDVSDPGIGTGHAITVDGLGAALTCGGNTLQGSGSDGYGIVVTNGGTAKEINTSTALAEPETLTAAQGDLILDGVARSWSNLDNADKKQLTSVARSLIAGVI